MDNNPVPPLVLRDPDTAQMSWLDKVFWHNIPIRNQLVRVTAPHFNHHVFKQFRRVSAVDADVELARRDYVLHEDPHEGAGV